MTPRLARALSILLALAAPTACDGPSDRARTEDVPAPVPAESVLASLHRGHGRVALSWIEAPSDGPPALRFALRTGPGWGTPRTVVLSEALVKDPVDPPGVVPLADGSLGAFWSTRSGARSYAHDLVFAVSRDDGASWSDPVRPHRDDSATEHGFATCVPDPEGPGASLIWLDGREAADPSREDAATQLRSARWEGTAFGPESILDPRVCDCCTTAAARVGGALVAVYRDRLEGEVRDIGTARLGAAGWTESSSVHRDGWALTACPTNGPAAVAAGDRLAVAWFTAASADPRVMVAFSDDGGASFGEPVRVDTGNPVGRVDLAPLPTGAVAVVWVERTRDRGEVFLRRVEPTGATGESVVVGATLAGRAGGFPRVIEESAGRVLVAWTDIGPPARVRLVAASP